MTETEKQEKLEAYMKRPYSMSLVEDPVEGGYTLWFQELRGCITCAETIPDLCIAAKDAKRAWLEAEIEEGHPIPEPYVYSTDTRQLTLDIPLPLYKQLSTQAKHEGVSFNQYCLSLLDRYAAI